MLTSKPKTGSKRPRSGKRTVNRVGIVNKYAERGPNDCLTRAGFCKANAMSEWLYFDMKRKGIGPREIEINGRIIITPEAQADWRKEREEATAKARAERDKMRAEREAEAEREIARRTTENEPARKNKPTRRRAAELAGDDQCA